MQKQFNDQVYGRGLSSVKSDMSAISPTLSDWWIRLFDATVKRVVQHAFDFMRHEHDESNHSKEESSVSEMKGVHASMHTTLLGISWKIIHLCHKEFQTEATDPTDAINANSYWVQIQKDQQGLLLLELLLKKQYAVTFKTVEDNHASTFGLFYSMLNVDVGSTSPKTELLVQSILPECLSQNVTLQNWPTLVSLMIQHTRALVQKNQLEFMTREHLEHILKETSSVIVHIMAKLYPSEASACNVQFITVGMDHFFQHMLAEETIKILVKQSALSPLRRMSQIFTSNEFPVQSTSAASQSSCCVIQ